MPMTHTPSSPVAARPAIRVGTEQTEVARLAPTPLLRPVVRDDELAFVDALEEAAQTGNLPGIPPTNYGKALARIVTDPPDRTLTRIGSGTVIDHTDTADIVSIRTTVSPLTVLPGEQPRGSSAGGRTGQVREPSEGYDEEAMRLGLRVMLFDDLEHLRAWVADAIARSLLRATKRGRPQEIASTGVRRPISVSMTLLQFADGCTPAQWVPMVSDGISRLAVCAAGLLEQFEETPESAAEAISRRLVPATALRPASSAHELARKMRSNHDKVLRDFKRSLDIDGLTEHCVTLRQFLTIPADFRILAFDPATGEPHSLEMAMEAVVSDEHTGVDRWDQEDDQRHTLLRALKRLARENHVSAELVDLCAGRVDPYRSSLLPSGAGNVTDDRVLLRRAVTILATLLHPELFPRVKASVRALTGQKRLTLNQVIDHIAPIVCEPWGTRKPITRAWAYGGPVPAFARSTPLDPVHPDDYLDLLEAVLDPETPQPAVDAARLELALAGGTALIADGIITTALVGGSGSAANALPFRGPVSAAIEALTQTEEGLTALAVAANHFRPSHSARAARLPGIDMSRSDRVARDGVGVPVRTTETILAGYAAQALEEDPEQGASQDDAQEESTPLQLLQSRARHLPGTSRRILHDVELTKSLHDECGGPSGLTEHDLDTVHDSLSRALRLAGRLT